MRRHFSRKHIDAIRRFVPTVAPVQAAPTTEVITITTKGRTILSPEQITRQIAQRPVRTREQIAAGIARDFC